MYSINFPNMFNGAGTKLIKDHDATMSNLRLLLASQRTSLLGDPYFGTKLKSYLYNQKGALLADIIIDDIYTAINTFMPQLVVKRNDIVIDFNVDNMTADIHITALNKQNYTINTYDMNLIGEENN